MTTLINKLINKTGLTRSRSLNDTIYTFVVRGSGIVAGVIISIFLGRTLGPKGLGIISLTNQIAGVLLTIALLGIPVVVVKEISIAFGRKDWEHANSVMSTSLKISGGFGVALIGIVYLFIPYAVSNIFHEPLLKIPLFIAVGAMIFQIISSIISSGVNGYRKIWQSSLVNNALSLFLVGILLLIQYALDVSINVVIVAWDYAIARAFVAIVIALYWDKIHYPSTKKKIIPKPILKVALPLLFSRVVGIIATSADVVMIGWLLTAKDVGLYSVAAKIAIISTIILQVTNSVIAPKIASMYAEEKIKELEIMVQRITKYLGIIAFLIFIIILFSGKMVLEIWGKEFGNAYFALIFLSFSQAVSIAAGGVGLILTLCNQEKIWGILSFISASMNVVLNYFLINLMGYVGAAIATAITLISMNIVGIIIIKKRINVLVIPFKFENIKINNIK